MYAFLIIYYERKWKELPEAPASIDHLQLPGHFVSVIIPARNEEENMGRILNDLLKQDFNEGKFEILVINDESTDKTFEVASKLLPTSRGSVIQSEVKPGTAFKKNAIETGIRHAKGNIIVTTDADCSLPSTWLRTVTEFLVVRDAVFVAAPVKMISTGSFIENFQVLDFLVLQGITAASVHARFHFMSNGANIAYSKPAFEKVKGFEGINQVASGDDMLLMQKMAKAFPFRVLYCQSSSAIVETPAMSDWKSFFNQRIRWASKSAHYQDGNIKLILLLVYLFNLSLFLMMVGSVFNKAILFVTVSLIFFKYLVEFSFVKRIASFFEYKKLMNWFFVFQPVHIIYTVIAGFLGFFKKYEWKGRVVR